MNELKVFSNEQFGQVRTVVDDGKVWFCGSDVAKALGYSQTAKAVREHCKQNGCLNRTVIDSMGREQQAKFISEGNLYRLITHSKLPSAERFESWVFDEVLPEIRTTGGYESKPKANNEQLIQIAKIIAKCPDKRLPYVIDILKPMLPNDFDTARFRVGTTAKPYLPVNYGDIVKDAIEICGLCKQDIERKTGVSKMTMCRITSYKTKPTRKTLDKLRVVLDLPF